MIKRAFPVLLMTAASLISLHGQIQLEYSLREILDIGISRNPRIAAVKSRVDAEKAAWRQSRAYPNPRLGYEIGDAENYEGTINRTTQGLLLSQPLENPFKRHYRIQAAESEWPAEECHSRNKKKRKRSGAGKTSLEFQPRAAPARF
jgi:outer membrane protein TolC